MTDILTELLGIIRRRHRLVQLVLVSGLVAAVAVAANAVEDEEEPLELDPITVEGEADPLYESERQIHKVGEKLPELDTEANERKTAADKTLEALGLKGEGIQGVHPADQQRAKETLENLKSDGKKDD